MPPAGALSSKLLALSPQRADPRPVASSDGLNLVVGDAWTLSLSLSLFR